ncbi:MAG: hypothetical protein KF690_06275 [Bacteroidetes bacterium]|nr:hypothetical protein [Bacteroidota bacterium]
MAFLHSKWITPLLPALVLAVGLFTGCNNDPWKNAPKPAPGPGSNLLPLGVFQASVNNGWISFSQPYDGLGPGTAHTYDAQSGTLYIHRASSGFLNHPVLGMIPEGQWRLVIHNLDLAHLPIPFVYGQTALPPDYAFEYPIVWVTLEGYTFSFPYFELNETGNPGLLTDFRIIGKADNILHATFSGQYWDDVLGYYGLVSQGELRVQLSVIH